MSQTTTVKCAFCGEQSTESDFCSNCGVQIATAAGASSPLSPDTSGAASAPGSHESCPKCSAEREDLASPFCGTCGYNFITKQGGDVLPADPAPSAGQGAGKSTTSPSTGGGATAVAASQSGPRMDVVITVDPNVVNAPHNRPPLTFPLYDEESLIGRRNSSVKQTVAVDDEAISKRHALIVREPDGSYIVRDLNSTNGTKVNGTLLVAGADHPLKEGDVISMGEYTLITVQAVRGK